MNRLRAERLAELAAAQEWAAARFVALDPLFAAGIALYAAEGAKRDGAVIFANTDPRMVAFFCSWLRSHFAVDETRLRCRLYLLPTCRTRRRWRSGRP